VLRAPDGGASDPRLASGRVEQNPVLGDLELDAFLGVVRCDPDAYDVLGLFGGALAAVLEQDRVERR
jgi:hypothetical protein